MTDILDRLRLKEMNGASTLEEILAADEIERVRGENSRFRAALFSSHSNLPNPDGELMAALGPKT